jgi:hypothetical protein
MALAHNCYYYFHNQNIEQMLQTFCFYKQITPDYAH